MIHGPSNVKFSVKKISGLKTWSDVLTSVNLAGSLKDLVLSNIVLKVDVKLCIARNQCYWMQ